MEARKGRRGRRLLPWLLAFALLLPATAARAAPYMAVTGASHPALESATVYGYVNTDGLPTVWAFQYGTSTAYGHWSRYGEIPPGQGAVMVAVRLSGLMSGTVYHYRLAAIPVTGTGLALTGALYGADAVVAPVLEQLELDGASLLFSGSSILVRLRCVSLRRCVGVLTLHAPRPGGARGSRCARAAIAVGPGALRAIRVRVSGGCAARLRRDHPGRAKLILSARLTSPQVGFTQPVAIRR